MKLTASEAKQVVEILSRRANEIAGYNDDHRDKIPASVEFALTRETERLRHLAERVNPTQPEVGE